MACGGLRMHWCHSGGKANSTEEKQQQSSGLGWIRSFSKQELVSNKLLFIDPKSQQKQKSQAHCSSLRLVNHHLQDQINRVNTTPNSFNFNRLIRSDQTSHHWRKMSNVHQNTRILEDEEDQISQKLDHWIRDCLAEIVSNIGEAPLLAHIYDDDEEQVSSSSIKIMIEKAVGRGRWEAESPTTTPNGVILVEELNSSSKEGVVIRNENKSNDVGSSSSSSTSSNQHHKVWGVLIQGKGVNRIGHACYILKTCRVQSLFGFCTHFCLTRVDCFVDSAEIQLQKMWLHR